MISLESQLLQINPKSSRLSLTHFGHGEIRRENNSLTTTSYATINIKYELRDKIRRNYRLQLFEYKR